jgi:hypothetical protein
VALGDRSLQAEAERAAKNFLRRFIKQFRNLTGKVFVIGDQESRILV